MNCNVCAIFNNVIFGDSAFNSLSFISKQINYLNLKPEEIELFSFDKNKTFDIINEKVKREGINFFIIDSQSFFKIKEMLTKINNDILYENKNLKDSVINYFRNKNLPLPNNIQEFYTIPSKCKAIVNPNGINQGLYFKQNGSYNFFLPNTIYDLKNIFNDAIIPFISEIDQNLFNKFCFKTFGITKSDIQNLLETEIKNKDKVFINIFDDNLDCTIALKAKKDNSLLEEYVNLVYQKLNNFIYSNEDISIYKLAFDLLKLNNLTISFAESITGGNVISKFISNNDGASKYALEGQVTYTNDAKINRLKVSEKTLDTYTDVSSETTYEMAVGLLKTTNANIVLSTTGYASPNKKGTGGTVFIAVGDKKSIDVYKNVFVGDRETVIESATKACYFYLIKKLKRNDFYLEKEII